MSERYKQVKLYENFKFYPTSPIDILKGAIYIDNMTSKAVFQLKFINMQDKHIKAIYIQIIGSNDLGEKIENQEYTYLDLNVGKGQEFGTNELKELRNNTIRNINVIINKVIYEDNTIWENTKDTSYDRVPLNKIDENLLFLANQKAIAQGLQLNNIYYPTENQNYWTCICGAYNSNSYDKCYRCSCSKDIAFNRYNKNELQKDLAVYKEQEQEKQKQKQAIKKQKLKKIKKITIICIPIIVILVIMLYLFYIESAKSNKYKNAIEDYNNKDFDEAIELFTELGDYKDSKTYTEKSNNEKSDIETIKKCAKYYNEQGEYFYEECKKLGKEIQYNRAEQYISQLRTYGYYDIIDVNFSLRETYLKYLNELKTNKFQNEKEIILKMDEKYQELYNFYITYPKEDNYTDYVNEAYRIYKEIVNYNEQIKQQLD